jgi:HK97 family phage portal protein
MAFLVTAGQLAEIERATPVIASTFGSSVDLGGGLIADYDTIYRTQPNVRTCIDFLGRNIAQLGLHVYRRVSDVDRERVTAGPLAELVTRPNPSTTRYRFIDGLVHDLAIFDNAYFAKSAPSDGRFALYRIPPKMVTPLGDSPLVGATGYRLRGNRGERILDPGDVLHFRGYNPTDPRVGVSPIEALRRVLIEEFQAAQYREQLWRNGARMGGYLRRPVDAPKWADESRQRFRAQWQQQYSGDGPNAGGTPILEDGMEWVKGGMTPEQAQYLEARKLTREEVASAYHIPLPMVGILDHATFSNITEQHKNLYQDTLGPWLTMICEELALQLPELIQGETYVEFNLAEKLRGSFEEQAQQLQTAVGGPWLTRNEARARQNLPQIDGADELIVPLNVTTGASPATPEPAPIDQPVTAAAEQPAQHDVTVEA